MDCRNLPHAGFPRRLPAPVPQLSLWQVDLADPVHAAAIASASCLGPTEQAHCATLRQAADRRRFTGARVALRTVLAQRLECLPSTLRFRTGSHGKPYLEGIAAPAFNLAHAGDYAWIALAEAGGEVGVDIERIDPALGVAAMRELAAHCLTPRERAWLALLPADAWPRAFFLLWTAKEALLKALGLGIADHLQHVSVVAEGRGGAGRLAVVPESGQFAGQLAGHAAALARMRLYRLAAPDGYAAAIAWVPPA
ncbi:4'-phosphopantetheinyl transferase family protein [Cupriavidus alkaliphilus]|uniref:4'-phosphopantetheinyl transferase family protein n=1 Tax=Cupriavidus alkaliphilus TaxID=942866 RepID=UPI0016222647|nr:4'-phosphopantetheinyl transferase superfamily protein [Cupriavidus alkaliphilus]MBB2917414.1 4'-phosphopantetheinyl transferase [Cupriavidus alkaliphilus]MBB3012669.1 4'-phosphopantetheinyl transferase [Cupriavidus alkaliphilus]